MPPASFPPPASRKVHITSLLAGALLLGLGALACEEEKAVTSPRPAEIQSGGETAPGAASATAMGVIPLPINQTYTGELGAFRISQTTPYPTAAFHSERYIAVLATGGSSSGMGVITARSVGYGYAGAFQTSGASSTGTTLAATTVGTGSAGLFRITNTTSTAAALTAITNGHGPAIKATAGLGYALTAATTGLTGNVASFRIQNLSNAGTAVVATTSGKGFAIQAAASGSSGIAGKFTANGNFAGDFTGTTKGVRITTDVGGAGLQVINGSKNAVVGTATGARALYSEEATEVWFADYGFGQLEDGRARVLIDHGFAQTVSLDQPYHVFLQPYGDAELYVEERTPLGFVVKAREGNPDVEFGYRVVAKRTGFESQRLERAPWADGASGLHVNAD